MRRMSPHAVYLDRLEAGRRLAAMLAEYRGRDDVVVLGIPRGGLPVAAEIAAAIDAPLDVMVVRKVGVPFAPELAMGAVASGGVRVINSDVVSETGVSERELARAVAAEADEVRRRERAYRDSRRPLAIRGKTVILVDDGIATGASVRAAVRAARLRRAREVVVATPLASVAACTMLEREADRVVCPLVPGAFGGVGEWYEDFSPTSDEEVRSLLARGR